MSDQITKHMVAHSAGLVDEIVSSARDRALSLEYESPIEEMFATALCVWISARYGQIGFRPVFGWTEREFRARSAIGVSPPEFGTLIGCVAPQVKIGDYRVDFLLLHEDGLAGLGGIVIECDGHDFHERTKEQAARDKARDRALQSRGLKVFRFTGSEIWADPLGCAEQVLEYAATAAEMAGNLRFYASEGNFDAVRSSLEWRHKH